MCCTSKEFVQKKNLFSSCQKNIFAIFSVLLYFLFVFVFLKDRFRAASYLNLLIQSKQSVEIGRGQAWRHLNCCVSGGFLCEAILRCCNFSISDSSPILCNSSGDSFFQATCCLELFYVISSDKVQLAPYSEITLQLYARDYFSLSLQVFLVRK